MVRWELFNRLQRLRKMGVNIFGLLLKVQLLSDTINAGGLLQTPTVVRPYSPDGS
jgi:hypothetical protein